MQKVRVSAVIIENKKILLVTGYDESFYWTPGGKIEINETPEEALKRELIEELSIEVISAKLYLEYTTLNSLLVKCFIVKYKGNFKPKKEITKIFWYSKENFEKKNPKVDNEIEKNLITKLRIDKII